MVGEREIEVLAIAPSVAVVASPPRRRRHAKSTLVAVAVLGATAGVAWLRYDYWTIGRFLASTGDAYEQVEYTTVAPKISGYIDQVLVEDSQPVKGGQVLAQVDDRDFRTARDQPRADAELGRGGGPHRRPWVALVFYGPACRSS